ncbi:hypothetical protein [uncultured Ruegeria sp.]|uniref:hypothetical protein n=1 Tax=uncultured Ruegeria sp. TaxID=259304 RepID=UPI002637FD3D|nr:hypothetical protein [uncultured Ruegeria sp.]
MISIAPLKAFSLIASLQVSGDSVVEPVALSLEGIRPASEYGIKTNVDTHLVPRVSVNDTIRTTLAIDLGYGLFVWPDVVRRGLSPFLFDKAVNSSRHGNPVCWGTADIPDLEFAGKANPIAHIYEVSQTVNRHQLRANLRLANFASVSGHFLGGLESAPDVIYTKSSYDGHRYGRQKHQERPSGHIPLGLQIALGAFMLVSGLHHANNAFRLGCSIKPGTGAIYLILGMSCIGIGIGLMLSGLFP